MSERTETDLSSFDPIITKIENLGDIRLKNVGMKGDNKMQQLYMITEFNHYGAVKRITREWRDVPQVPRHTPDKEVQELL